MLFTIDKISQGHYQNAKIKLNTSCNPNWFATKCERMKKKKNLSITVVHEYWLLYLLDWIVPPVSRTSLSIPQNIRTNSRVPRHLYSNLRCPDCTCSDPITMNTLLYCHSYSLFELYSLLHFCFCFDFLTAVVLYSFLFPRLVL